MRQKTPKIYPRAGIRISSLELKITTDILICPTTHTKVDKKINELSHPIIK